MLFSHTENWAIPILFCRKLLGYVYIPVIHKVLGIFRTTVWNNHHVRKQENKDLSTWVPEHIFSFPEKYGSKNYGLNITEEQLVDIAMECDIFDSTDDHLSKDFCWDRWDWTKRGKHCIFTFEGILCMNLIYPIKFGKTATLYSH